MSKDEIKALIEKYGDPQYKTNEYSLYDLIAVAQQLTAQLATKDREIEGLKTERDLAVAHDSQSYPTAQAYELTCKLLSKAKAYIADEKAELENKCPFGYSMAVSDRLPNDCGAMFSLSSVNALYKARIAELEAALNKAEVVLLNYAPKDMWFPEVEQQWSELMDEIHKALTPNHSVDEKVCELCGGSKEFIRMGEPCPKCGGKGKDGT